MDVTTPLNPAELFSAKGLVVVITGGGSGIGLAIASTLYQNGASKIYLLGRRLSVLESAIHTLESSPSAPTPPASILTPISCDVTSLPSLRSALTQIESTTSHIDILINNAGILGPKNGPAIHSAQSITQLRDAMIADYPAWSDTFAINTQAVIGVSALFLPLLEAANTRRGWAPGRVVGATRTRTPSSASDAADDRLAQIITIASVASYMRWISAGLAYNASKSAAAHLAKMMATFLAEWGVRSNVVCPGPYPSEMTATNAVEYRTDQIPQGRMGKVEDVAGVMLFLVGRAGAYVNGNVVLTDGGRTGVHPAVY